NVLKAEFRGHRSCKFERVGPLPRIYPVEDRAVMDEKVNAETALPRERNEHEIIAEDLHLADALARAASNLDIELVARVVDVDHEPTGSIIEMFREVGKQAQCL